MAGRIDAGQRMHVMSCHDGCVTGAAMAGRNGGRRMHAAMVVRRYLQWRGGVCVVSRKRMHVTMAV